MEQFLLSLLLILIVCLVALYHYCNLKNNENPSPKDGQAALDNSVLVKEGPYSCRIGISEGEIVVLQKTEEGVHHGYIVKWDEVKKNQLIINTLIQNGLVNNKGNILKK